MPKRRRGSRHLARRLPPANQRFELLVERALAGIPQPFRDSLREVAIVIEDEPTAEQLRDGSPDADGLYGLYEGTPRTEWAADAVAAPNKITLFRVPLEDDFADPDALAEEVRLTVIHELAHHLGIDDDRLHELGVG